MDFAQRRSHWEDVYTGKDEAQVSWFQEAPEPSLELLQRAGATASSAVIDIGGGASRLVDCLMSLGFEDVTVLDLSDAALAAARRRLGDKASAVQWIVTDATQWRPSRQYEFWHDRAAFHFLTEGEGERAYVERLRQAVGVGGHVIMGTFAPDGPEKCSGLPVQRHDAASLATVLGPDFELVESRRHEHHTPWGSVQRFQFSTFRRIA